MNFSDLHFLRPMALLALPIVWFIIWQLQRKSSKDDGWSKICDPHLLDAIKVQQGGKGSQWSMLLWPISLIAILAIAGPAFRKLPTPVIKNQSALVIALDVSRSMLADDVKPNRLERAKFKINDILAKRKDGQTALLVYSGDAFVVTPLTDDTETIDLMLKAISPEIMPVQGSRVDIALQKSEELLKQAGYANGDVLLIGDGVNLSKAENKAKELHKHHITTSVLAIGTKTGAPIPLQTGFLKDNAGNIVVPKLQVDKLKQLASSGYGRFAQITGDSADIDYLLPSVENDKKKQTEEKEESAKTEKFIDEGPWLTLLLIPLMALLFRKGMLLALFLVVGLQTPQSSYAFSWDDLWLNADQQAAKHIQQGDAKKALELAKSPEWKATAAFREKDYQQAQQLFDATDADGLYNKGNALAASGKLKEALDAYNESLKIRAGDEDTLYNKEQVEKALEEQKKQEQENKDKNQDNKDNKEQDKKDQNKQDKQDQKDQENQENQENKDQKQQDGENKDQDSEQNQQNQKQDQQQKDNPDQQKEQKKPSEMTEEEKKQEQEKQKQLEKADMEAKEKEKEEKEQQLKMTPQEMAEQAENKEAIEQWLRRIPDDPGGLLRRKFYYQYNQQNNKPDEQEDW